MVFKNEVCLTNKNISIIKNILYRERHTPQVYKRARALLLAHEGVTDTEISEKTLMSVPAIEKMRKRFVDNGFELTLYGAPKAGRPRILTAKDEANLIALACEKAPDGEARQTIRGLAGKFITQEGQHVCHDTVYRTLKKNDLKPWQHKE
jgi:transposase